MKGYVSIDGEKSFPCVYNKNERWNGFIVPYFSLRTLKRVLKHFKCKIVKEGEKIIVIRTPYSKTLEDIYSDKCGLWSPDGWTWQLSKRSKK